MLKRFLCIISLFLAAFSASAVEDIYVTDTLQKLPEEIELRNLYLQALCHKKQGRSEIALGLLNKYVERDSANGAVFMDIANMYIAAGKYKEALQNMRKAALLEPDNYWIQRSEALLLIQNGETEEGLNEYDKLVRLCPDKVEDASALANLYTRAGKKQQALAMWNHYENQMGITEPVSVQKFDLLYSLGKKKQAVAVLDSLVATDRSDPHFFLVKANSLAYKGEIKAAEKCLADTRKRFPEADYAVEQELSLIYLSTGNEKKAVASIKRLLQMPEVDFEGKRSLLLSSVADSALSPHFGNADFELLVKQYPANEQACLIYSDFLLAKNDTSGYAYVRKALAINPKNEFAWNALLSYYERGDSTTYAQTLNAALEECPGNGQFLFYEGTLNMRRGNRSKALECWRKSAASLAKDPEEKRRTSVVYTVIGDVCMEAKDTAAAFAAYDSAVAYNSANIEVLNNFAYFLAETGRDLDKAERMSGITIAAQPKNPTFLDTYAWILYKQHKFSTARLYMEQAMMLGGDKEVDCLGHYGDILYKDGDKAGAWEQWKKALQLSKDPTDSLKRKAETGVLDD